MMFGNPYNMFASQFRSPYAMGLFGGFTPQISPYQSHISPVFSQPQSNKEAKKFMPRQIGLQYNPMFTQDMRYALNPLARGNQQAQAQQQAQMQQQAPVIPPYRPPLQHSETTNRRNTSRIIPVPGGPPLQHAGFTRR